MITDFCEHFTLSEDPFMQDVIYPAPTQTGLLDELEYLLQFGQSALVLTGRSGVGKSTLLRQLAGRLTSEVFILTATDFANLDLLLLTLTEELLLPVHDGMNTSAMEALIADLALEQDPSAAPVILVDRAETLPQGAMLSLLKLAAPDHGRVAIRLVLVCPEGFASDLPAKMCAVTPLNLAEAVALLNFKMSEAGFQGEAVFTANQVEPWWLEAEGNVNVLHDRARQWLIDQASKAVATPRALSITKRAPIPLAHMVTVAVLVGVLGTVYLYRSDSGTPATGSVLEIPPPTPTSIQQPNLVLPVVEKELPLPESPPTQQPIAGEPAGVTDDASDIVSDATTDRAMEPVAEESPPAAQVAVSEPSPRPLRPADSKLGDDEQVVLSWPESAYTIQVLAVAARDSAEGFVARHSNTAMLVLKTERSGKPWYVVISGRFASLAEARQAQQRLPEALREAGPWPRKVGELQEQLLVN